MDIQPHSDCFRRDGFRCGWIVIALLVNGWLLGAPSIDGKTAAAAEVDFTRDIQPILASRCYACHGPETAESGLSLTGFDAATVVCESGEPAIVPGDADAGLLISRITSDDEFERMPPEGEPLTEDQVANLRQWIDEGAKFEPHWSFRPRTDPAVPEVADRDWQRHPVDAFIYRGLQDRGLSPAEPAGRREALRRLSYGLIGLPPTSEEIDSFLADRSPLAWQRQVDRLLASPHHGEAWGRHWLDLVRYAETNSFERDGPKANAWKYRDYVIDSINHDKPFDQFVREQLAGDALPIVTPETLTATGYFRLGIWDDEPADPLQARMDEFDDLVATTGQVMLGLTIQCARCHDHKIDPIPQRDYYSMVALMADVTSFASRFDTTGNNQVDVSPPRIAAAHLEMQRRIDHLEQSKRQLEQEVIVKFSAPDQRATEGPAPKRRRVLQREMPKHADAATLRRWKSLIRQIEDAETERAHLPPRTSVLGLAKTDDDPPPTFVLARGNPNSPTDPVDPAFPTIFADAKPQLDDELPASQRRLAMADWLTDADHMLTARVMANRVWQFHFGRGLVRSSNNFGRMGTPPTHPELLDYLASRLIEYDWSLARLSRLILTSRTYRMASSRPAAEADRSIRIDPENDFYWRFDPRRLTAEEVRDSMLAAAGRLDHRVGGPSVRPPLSAEVLAGQSRPGSGWSPSGPADSHRRSVYIHVKRSLLMPLLAAFDFPDPDLSCEARFETLGPGQALALLNSDFAQRLAAEMTRQRDSQSDSRFAASIIESVLKRPATTDEIEDAATLIADLVAEDLSRERARSLFALSVLNWNEFLFLD